MIKFRAWDKQTKKMCIVKGWHEFNGGEVTIKRQQEFASYQVPADSVILMQSTGLFDRNGQEIFEGDLLDMSDPTENIVSSGNPILEVRFNGLEFTVKGDIENGEMSLREFKEICELVGIPLKVIGNVYENPDLVTT